MVPNHVPDKRIEHLVGDVPVISDLGHARDRTMDVDMETDV